MTPLIPITAGLRIAARLGNSDLVLPVTQQAAALANTPRLAPAGIRAIEMLEVIDVTWTDQGAEYRGHVVWVRWGEGHYCSGETCIGGDNGQVRMDT